MKSLVSLLFAGSLDDNVAVLDLDYHLVIELLCECALRTLYGEDSSVELYVNACGDCNGHSAYS